MRATLGAAIGLFVCGVALAAGEPPDATTHTVTIEGMRFDPEHLTVTRGDTIVWVNKDLVPHTATSKAGMFDSKTIAADESWSLVVRTEGEFAYDCTFHPTMIAMLRVE